VVAGGLADQRGLARGEAGQPGVQDQVARVLVVVVVVDGGADVVQDGRGPQQLALESDADVTVSRWAAARQAELFRLAFDRELEVRATARTA